MFRWCWWNRSPYTLLKCWAISIFAQSVLYCQDYAFNGCSGEANGCEKSAKCVEVVGRLRRCQSCEEYGIGSCFEKASGLFYNQPAGIFGGDGSGVRMRFAAIFLVVSLAMAAAMGGTPSSTRKAPDKKESRDWPIYGGTPENS